MSDTVKTALTKLYIATFNRAPDAAGLAYWSDKMTVDGWPIELVAQSFFDQPETQALYPPGTDSRQFVESVYNNVLHRSADEGGLDYWSQNIDSGSLSQHQLIIAMINAVNAGSSATDLALLDNLANIGSTFANLGLNDTALAKQALSGITSDVSSIAQALSRVESFSTLLTKGTLNLDFHGSGTAGRDFISSQLNSSNQTEVLQGFKDNDTLAVVSGSVTNKAILLGGTGDDLYQLGNAGVFVVADVGGDDTLQLSASLNELASFTLNDGRDLVLYDNNSGVLIPNWQNPASRIENFKLEDGNYNYLQLSSAIASRSQGNMPDSIIDQFKDSTNFPSNQLDDHIALFEYLATLENPIEQVIAPQQVSGSISSNFLIDQLL